MSNEGYVKYSAEHKTTVAIEIPQWEALNEARTHLHKLGLVGIYQDGVGYGNVSARFRGEEFIITGTAMGAKPLLSRSDYCLVHSFDIARNHVVSSGPVQASSESMTHGAIYRSCAGSNYVIHIHSKAIFNGMLRDNYPATPQNAAYGTPELAFAIGKCAADRGKDEGQMVMAGHEDGIIAYSSSIQRNLSFILELYNKYGG